VNGGTGQTDRSMDRWTTVTVACLISMHILKIRFQPCYINILEKKKSISQPPKTDNRNRFLDHNNL